jgi:hypothetical protein
MENEKWRRITQRGDEEIDNELENRKFAKGTGEVRRREV